MNAVEAVEQLGALGRKLQAREVGLQQPSLRLQTALRQSADWEKVLGDPVAALSRLLGAAGGGPVRANEAAGEPEAPVSSAPPAPFRWEEVRPPAGSGISTGVSGYSSGQSGDPGSGSGPAGAIRLARRQTSLLGILSANLEDRAYAGMGEQGSAAALTGDVRPERRPAAQDEDAAELSAPVVRRKAQPSSFASQDQIWQSRGQAAHSTAGSQQDEPGFRDGGALLTGASLLTRHGTVSDWQSGEPGAAADAGGGANVPGESDVAARMDVWAYESLPQHGQEGAVRIDGLLDPGERRKPARGTANGLHIDMPSARNEEPMPEMRQSQARPEGQVGDWDGRLQNAGVAPVQDGVLASVDDRQEERPLSMAQIEQVLSALDERLELMLLRMYGSAGGLP